MKPLSFFVVEMALYLPQVHNLNAVGLGANHLTDLLF